MQKSAIEKFFGSAFILTFCMTFLMAGIGKISLKSFGIPISLGGGLEKIIVWSALFASLSLILRPGLFFKTKRTPLMLFSLFLAGVLISGCEHSLGSKESREYLIHFIASSCIFFLTLYASESPRTIRMALLCLILGGIFTLVQGFISLYSHPLQSYADLSGTTAMQRLSTPVGHPNFLGAFLMLLLPLTLIPSWRCLSARQNPPLKILLALIFLLGIIFSYSRTAWMGTAFGLFIFTMLSLSLLQRFLLSTLLLLGLSGLLWISCTPTDKMSHPLLRRISTLTNMKNDDNVIERIYAWKTAIKIIQNNPLKGIGTGNDIFRKEYEGLLPPSAREILPHPHQTFLHLAAVFGLPVLALFLILLGNAFFNLLSGGRDPSFLYLKICLLSSLCSYLLYGIFDSALFNDRVSSLLWFVLGLFFIDYNPFIKKDSSHADSL